MARKDVLSIGAQELILFIEKDSSLKQAKMIEAMGLARKKASKRYDRDVGLHSFRRVADMAARQYVQQRTGSTDHWQKVFPLIDRNNTAKAYLKQWGEDWKRDKFEAMLPTQLQKAATRKAAQAAFKHGNERRGK